MKNTNSNVSQTKPARILCIVGTVLFAACLVVYIACYGIQLKEMAHYSAEYRDGSVFRLIEDLASGHNPYAVSVLTSPIPENVLDSGFFHIFPAVLLRMIGIPSSAAIYITNFIYLILIGFFMVRVCNNFAGDSVNNSIFCSMTILSAYAVIFFMQRQTILITRPDTFCAMLLMWILAMWTSGTITNRKVYLSSFFCAVILYAKIHYMVIGLSLLFYLLFVSKQNNSHLLAVKLVGSGIVFVVILFLLQQYFYPVYLSIWIPRILEMFFGNMELSAPSFAALYLKLKRFAKVIFPFLLIPASGISLTKRSYRMPATVCLLWINIVVNGLVLLYVGRHPGADLWYFFVMLVPSLVALSAYYLFQMQDKTFVVTGLLLLCTIWSFASVKRVIDDTLRTQELARRYAEAVAIVDQYRGENMYLSPYLSNYSIEHGIYNYDNGDGFYVCDHLFLNSLEEKIPFFNHLFPYSHKVFDIHESYRKEILKKIQNKDYSIIVLDSIDCIPPGIEKEFRRAVTQNYSALLTMEDQTLTFYIPR